MSGYGTYADSGDVNSNDYAAAARTPDGRLVIAYLPTSGSVGVDSRRMTGHRVRAQWYGPNDGKYTTLAGSPFARIGTRTFTPPGKNHGGDEDWVLVLSVA